MGKEPTHEREVVGVFRDDAAARAAARAAEDAGVRRAAIRVGDQRDETHALRGEMREEIDHTVAGPGPVGPVTKEQVRGLGKAMPVAIVVGAVLGIPFGLLPIGQIPLPARLLIAAIAGAVAGATFGLLLGGGFSKGPAPRLAPERGVTVGVTATDPEQAKRVAVAMRELDPIRVDLVSAAGDPTGAVQTEESAGDRRRAGPSEPAA